MEVSKKKDVDAFLRMLKKHQFEAELLQALAPVFAKEPASRTDFDNLVLTQLEETVTGSIATQTQLIEDAGPVKEERAATMAAAEGALAGAQAAVETTNASMKEVASAVKGGEAAVREARKSLKACGPGAKDVAAAATVAESALTDFSSGALATFKELRDRMVPVEEPPKEEVPAPVQEPPKEEVPAPVEEPP